MKSTSPRWLLILSSCSLLVACSPPLEPGQERVDDIITRDVRADYDKLVDFLLTFAEQQLKKNGGYYPFSAVIELDRELTVTATFEEDEQPDPIEVLSFIETVFKSYVEEESILATGVCVDMTLSSSYEGEERDAAVVHLDHRDGESMDIILPYSIGANGEVLTGGLISSDGSKEFFPNQSTE